LTEADAARAVALFDARFGGGDIKLFGGEPLLEPAVVRAAMEEARHRKGIRWVYLSTNGLGLDEEWLAYLKDYPKGILTLSLDGTAEQNRRLRRPLNDQVVDAYDHILSLREPLLETPRVVVTQTIAPPAAETAVEGFEHLLSLGFWRFNLLPGYYLVWKDEQLQALKRAFGDIAARIEARWNRDERFYLRNLFTYAPTPFFNTGLVVDADGTIHPSNVGLSGQLDGLRGQTQVGTLDAPPTALELEMRAQEVNDLLHGALAPRVWESTQRVDAELTALCRRLYPVYATYRKRRNAA